MTLSKKNGGKVMKQDKKRYEDGIFSTFVKLGYKIEITKFGDFKFEKKLPFGVGLIFVDNDDWSISCYLGTGDNVEPWHIGKEEFELLYKLCKLRGWWYE